MSATSWAGYQEKNEEHHLMTFSNLIIDQQNRTIAGEGTDEYGDFKISGSISEGNGMKFKKKYAKYVTFDD